MSRKGHGDDLRRCTRGAAILDNLRLIKLYNRTYQHYLQVATHLAGIYRIGHNDPMVTGLEQQKHALEDRLDGILFRLSLVGCSPHDYTAYEQELLKKQGIYKHE